MCILCTLEDFVSIGCTASRFGCFGATLVWLSRLQRDEGACGGCKTSLELINVMWHWIWLFWGWRSRSRHVLMYQRVSDELHSPRLSNVSTPQTVMYDLWKLGKLHIFPCKHKVLVLFAKDWRKWMAFVIWKNTIEFTPIQENPQTLFIRWRKIELTGKAERETISSTRFEAVPAITLSAMLLIKKWSK